MRKNYQTTTLSSAVAELEARVESLEIENAKLKAKLAVIAKTAAIGTVDIPYRIMESIDPYSVFNDESLVKKNPISKYSKNGSYKLPGMSL